MGLKSHSLQVRCLTLAGVLLTSAPVWAQALEQENCAYMGTCQSEGMFYMGTGGGQVSVDGGKVANSLSTAAATAAFGAALSSGNPVAIAAAAAALGAAVDNSATDASDGVDASGVSSDGVSGAANGVGPGP